MALWPNGRYMTRSTYKGFGTSPGGDAYIKGLGDRMNRFIGETFARTASTPDGYDVEGYVPAIRAGAMSARPTVVSSDFTGNALAGGPMTAAATTICTLTGTSGLSMIVSMAGTATVVTLTGNNLQLKLTIGLEGTATWTLTGASSLSMVVPIEGTGSVCAMSGTSDLRGLLSMSGEWTPFTDLSPEGLAAAVWNAVASEFNTAGTMGNKLNTASSGGVDMGALADAIIAALNATTGARTLGEHLQIQTAVLAGSTIGAGSGHIEFIDGTTTVEADVPTPGNTGDRTNVVVTVV